jgi:hypothetical protein
MLMRGLAILAVASLGAGLSTVASARPVVAAISTAEAPNQGGGSATTTEAGATTPPGSVAVWVSVSGSTAQGAVFSGSSVRSAPPGCWYARGWTGAQYAQYQDGGAVERARSQMPDGYWSTPYPDYGAHAADTVGHWYEPSCSDQPSASYVLEYAASHPPVYVLDGQDPPAVSQEIPPEVLAQIAYESMDLPQGTIRWSPSLNGSGATVVNMDTSVWVEGAPTSVSVTAQVDSGAWARVDARLDHLELQAPGADPASCPDTGVAWAPDTDSTCVIVFYHSSANQPVKPGQTLPTATLTATGVWTATWVSSLDATPTVLDPQEIATTTEIPVAEIQTIVTYG